MQKWAILSRVLVFGAWGLAGCALSVPSHRTPANLPPASPEIEWIQRGESSRPLAGNELTRAQEVVTESWRRLSREPRLQAHLPARFAVIFDADWDRGAGYFSPEEHGSDGRPALVFNPRSFVASSNAVGIVVHEFVHLMHYSLVPVEDSWLREGLAMLMEWRLSNVYPVSFLDGIRRPRSSLTESVDLSHRSDRGASSILAQYGHIFLFMAYVDRVCDGNSWWPRVFSGTAQSGKGVKRMDEALRLAASSNPICHSFEEVFVAFQKARFRPDLSRDSGYVLIVGAQPPVEPSRPARLEPYSAAAYRPQGSADCALGDHRLDPQTCLAVRLR